MGRQEYEEEVQPAPRWISWTGPRYSTVQHSVVIIPTALQGCYFQLSTMYTTAVTAFPPNAYGLFNMVGNVWEWVAGMPPQPPPQKDARPQRILRGGSFIDTGDGNLLSHESVYQASTWCCCMYTSNHLLRCTYFRLPSMWCCCMYSSNHLLWCTHYPLSRSAEPRGQSQHSPAERGRQRGQ